MVLLKLILFQDYLIILTTNTLAKSRATNLGIEALAISFPTASLGTVAASGMEQGLVIGLFNLRLKGSRIFQLGLLKNCVSKIPVGLVIETVLANAVHTAKPVGQKALAIKSKASRLATLAHIGCLGSFLGLLRLRNFLLGQYLLRTEGLLDFLDSRWDDQCRQTQIFICVI
jgi:hypothetical protein